MPTRWWRSPVLVYPLLLAFVWTALELWRLPEAWAQEPPPRPGKRTAVRGDDFTRLLKELHRLTKAAVDAQAPGGDLTSAMAAVRQARPALHEADRKVRDQFAATEQKLRQANLPAEILERHTEAVRSYDAKHQELDAELTEAEDAHGRISDPWNFQDRAPDQARLRHHLRKAGELLDKYAPKPTHRPLDPHKLPSRPAEPRWKAPQTSARILPTYARPGSPWLAAQDELDPAYVTHVAATGDALVAQVLPKTSGLSATPTAADLAPTEDVQITQEIRDLAVELNNDPVKIYEYVRNTIDFEPTWGSIKGSVLTLWEKSGNAFDTASLLIALCRAANIPARYVLGTIQVPAAQAQNWVGGVATAQIAAAILASGGVPTAYNATHVTLEHVWVEAYVPFAHYRGIPLGQTGKTWIPLDPSFKQYTYTQGLDVPAIVGFDVDAFIQQAQVGATIDPVTGSATHLNQAFIESETTRLRQLLQTHIETTLPNATLLDITGGRVIAKLNLGLLPASLPYRAVATTADAVALSDALRHHVTIALLDEFGLTQVATVTRSLPQVATQKITISYGPASDADRATLESLASQQATSIPAYLLRLMPEVRVDETLVATAESIGMGQHQVIVVTLEGPNQAPDQMRHERSAGDYSLVSLDLGISAGRRLAESHTKLERTKARIAQRDLLGLTKHNTLGELVFASAESYWAALALVARVSAGLRHTTIVRLPSEGLSVSAVEVDYLFGLPISARAGGFAMDVARTVLGAFSSVGDKELERAFSLSIGIASSYLEGEIYEQLFQRPGKGVSAARILQAANQQGIPVYRITQENLSAFVPLLTISAEVRGDIQNAVAAGKVVHVPQKDVAIGGWTGIGYFVVDPMSGAGAFLITGGLAGGSLIPEEDFLWAILAYVGVVGSLLLTVTIANVFLGLLAALAVAVGVWYLSVLAENFIQDRDIWRPTSRQRVAGITNILAQTIISVALTITILISGPVLAPTAVMIAVFYVLLATGYDWLINRGPSPWHEG
jgi:transglutaminase-like putative cysteine protease